MTTVPTRPDLTRDTPEPFTALNQLAHDTHAAARNAGLAAELLELIQLRASQLNGCGFCTALHTRSARELGQSSERIEALPDWRDSAAFTGEEQAALQLAEAVTVLPSGQVPDEDFRVAAEHFDSAQLAHLVWAVSIVNAFNRLAIATAADR
ncbi:carboxymuconolactone decarboxylase family protein [Saccharopolyspora sp. HNM0983]|uniref:Carboxymuconolactone decarboxylase family protein n=1 Tax=Saccharopolyspora montiporae TaxID=2781240 RepID=A0A929B954_9PSEU|nr:carboxymuconolactone decarboxylase family protein [Saccharopolyspora sp. HNM0983]MBE9373706.1 carboxymuconolactone decarboxylase family protein [Saccharopolyspora sp. HNM0983]